MKGKNIFGMPIRQKETADARNDLLIYKGQIAFVAR
jgi:hypothetical protein